MSVNINDEIAQDKVEDNENTTSLVVEVQYLLIISL